MSEKIPLQLEMEIRDALSSVAPICNWGEGCTATATHILSHKDAEPSCSEYVCDECVKLAQKGLAMMTLARVVGVDPDAHLHCTRCSARFEINEAVIKEI